MFKEVIQDMRNSGEYRETLEKLAKKRFISELPNSYHLIIEILSKDPSSKELLEKIKVHMEEGSIAGKVALQKEERNENVVTVHMYDNQEELSAVTLSSNDKYIKTNYKVEQTTFDEMEKIAIDYDLMMAEIKTDIKDKDTY